jgi:hypothetical protein
MARNRIVRTGNRGVVAAGIMVAVVAACGGLVAACAGVWGLLSPLASSGCDTARPERVTSRDLVGTYVTADGGRLDLRADGTLTATGLASELDPYATPPRRVSGPGTWKLLPARDGVGDIQVDFDGPDGYGSYLEISGSRDEPWLYWYIGDPQGCDLYRFDRT